MLPVINAEFRVDQVKAYVNNDRVSGFDEDGGDVDLNRGDDLEIQILMENTENTTTQAKIKGILNNINEGDDITKEFEWFDVEADNDKQKTLTFNIPTEARIDNYDLDIEIIYKFSNGTEDDISLEYVVYVREEGTSEDIDLKSTLASLADNCSAMVIGLDTCFGYISGFQNKTGELSTCKEERGVCQTDIDNTRQNYDECNQERNQLKIDNQNLENMKKAMYTVQQCNNITITQVEKEKKSLNNMYGMIVGGGVIFWFFSKNKKKKETVADTQFYERG